MCFQGCKCSDSNNVNNKNFTTTTCYYSYFFIASLIFLATHLTSNVEPSIEYGISHTTYAIESLSSSLYPELVQFNNISNSFLQFIESDDTDRCLRSLPVTIDTSSINSHKNNSINDGNNDMKEKLIHFSSLLLPILNRTISVEHFLSPPSSSSSNSNSNSNHNIHDVINRVSSKIYNKSSGVTYRFQHYWYFVMTILSILLLLKQKLLLQLMLFPVIIITILMTIPTASIMTGNLYVASICANDGAMHHLVHLLNSISHNSINHGSRSSRSSRLLISSDSDLFNRILSANTDDSHSNYLHDGSSSSSSSSRKDKIIETLIYYLQDNPSSSSSSDDPVLSLVAKVNQPLHIIISSATNEINQINKISSSSSIRNNNSDGDDDRDRHGDTWNSSQLHDLDDLDKVKGCLNRMSQTATSVVSATDNIGASLSWSIIHNLLEEIIVDGVCDGVGNAVSVIVISSISNIVMSVILIWHISILYNSFDSNNSSSNNNGNDDETELSYLLGEEHGQGDKHNRDVNPDLTYASTGMTTIPTTKPISSNILPSGLDAHLTDDTNTNTSTTGNDAYLPPSSLQDHELATITTEQNRRRRSLFSPDKSSKRETTGNK